MGPKNIFTDEEAVLEAAKDYIGFRVYQRADGKNFAPRAACVVKPEDVEGVSRVLEYLHKQKVDVVPRTGGSSVTLGVEPVEGGVILDGSAMNKILKIDETDMMVTAQCGTPLEHLESVLNEKVTLWPLPQSLPMAHLGGLVATRSTASSHALRESKSWWARSGAGRRTIVRIKRAAPRTDPICATLYRQRGHPGLYYRGYLKFQIVPKSADAAYGVKGMQCGLDMVRDAVDGYKSAVVRLHDAAEMMVLGRMRVPPNMHPDVHSRGPARRSYRSGHQKYAENRGRSILESSPWRAGCKPVTTAATPWIRGSIMP